MDRVHLKCKSSGFDVVRCDGQFDLLINMSSINQSDHTHTATTRNRACFMENMYATLRNCKLFLVDSLHVLCASNAMRVVSVN